MQNGNNTYEGKKSLCQLRHVLVIYPGNQAHDHFCIFGIVTKKQKQDNFLALPKSTAQEHIKSWPQHKHKTQ